MQHWKRLQHEQEERCNGLPNPQIQDRYSNIVPFDFNRVVLKDGSYINASHIQGTFMIVI